MKTLLLVLLCGTLWWPIAGSAAGKQKVIFDCDLAGDVDDAFALALVLTSPELEVLGVVMDHGNTPGRARVACRFLYELGLQNIPVVVGRPTPGVVGESTETAGESNQFIWGHGFGKIKPIEQSAADFITAKLEQFPAEVVLFTVGPVCNIHDVLQKDPEVLKKAKKVVSMFGSFYMGYDGGATPSAEWNVRADIGSAREFLASGANPVLAGLDTTTFVKLNETNRTRLLYRNSPLTDALCGLYSLWRFEGYAQPDPTLFDAVAVGMVLWPELFTTRKAHVKVTDTGFTVLDDSKEPNCEIGLTIQKDEFIRRLMERLLKQNLMRH
jgi:purine nucleosidase